MKKKLLTILLSFAMVMTMIPFASITAFAGEIETVGDVLATVEDFPVGEYLNPPIDSWINEHGDKLYKNSENIYFNHNSAFPLNLTVTPDGDNYKLVDYVGCTLTFNMQEGVLMSIDFTSTYTDTYSEAIGTYAPNPNPTPEPEDDNLLQKIVKGVAIAAGAAAVAGVVGTVVKNVQKAAVAQQKAFQAKMQQQMVQKQVASIKTVLKGAGVVLSLANFGSSLGKLFQLNQFGFNQFGFR